jgi:hypothetical protein
VNPSRKAWGLVVMEKDWPTQAADEVEACAPTRSVPAVLPQATKVRTERPKYEPRGIVRLRLSVPLVNEASWKGRKAVVYTGELLLA